MKSWKKQLKDELNRAVPALRQDIKDAPILTAERDAPVVRNGNALAKRRLLWSIAAVGVLLFAVTFLLLGVFGVFRKPVSNDRLLFLLEINPSVSFVIDGNGKVQKITALNEDADVVLSQENLLQSMKNAPLADAVLLYTENAAKLGYLDVSKEGDAVRLSCAQGTNGSFLTDTGNSLRTYFRQNGIFAVVIEDAVAEEELCKRAGAVSQSLAQLTKTVEGLSEFYRERVPQNADAEMLKDLHDSYVIGEQMLEWVRGEMSKNIESIRQNAESLWDIVALNSKIMVHRDNPSVLLKDYWSVKKLPDAVFTVEFALMMEEMESRLTDYEATFGRHIDSLFEIKDAAEVYVALVGEDIGQWIAALNGNVILSDLSQIIGILENSGCDISWVQSLAAAPNTVEEYLLQAKTATERLNEFRLEQYLPIYRQERGEISEEDYRIFEKKLIDDYGSLTDYWDKK